ncbi:helix-turn-helix domain-containing protein [Candidatus Bathyarchaeota archaeon]|nr:helix-turn-helix domain-containing protein [Candidatus Bathyarchaeota archaeon]
MIRTTLSVKMPELWVCQITERYKVEISGKVGGSRAKAAGWCLVEIRGENGLLDTVLDEIRAHPSVGNVKLQSREIGRATIMVDIRRCEACKALMLSKYFLTYPVEIRNGYMTWLMVTDSNRTLGEICKRLEDMGCTVKILESAPLDEQKKLLTERQEEVIRVAFENGYFDKPKRSGSHAVAAKLGISAATFSEIVRAAQRRILQDQLRPPESPR